ncbi:pantoate--beta-alanine ligase [Maliponia aquimaris]|uniref:Pantothenate synthetase n=1 Tax=Maliponia aquimaris TaxID=1673631 RepID=A0A238K5K4_9RHOB|nr:pantoate--beta-alanine ligase [Maliponia aquimaris]SMX37724.1 Pantothenate synthetase [Maliponia aquimaris]
MTIEIVRHKAALRARVAGWRAAGARVGVVPTMGALHDGHLSLVRAAKADCDRVIVTLFVNPRQFNNPADLAAYPRTEGSDVAKLAPHDVDVLWAPGVDEMYPEGFATRVSVQGLPEVLCGAHRPGHFDGVATVVTKLLTQTGGDVAFFGEKDFQQLQIVRHMASDLDLPVEIRGCPTLREADGLAMSSRNARLDARARAVAPALFRALTQMAEGVRGGAAASALQAPLIEGLLAAGFDTVDYLEMRAEDDLALLDRPERPARVFGAAELGGVRLIDNLAV